MRIPFDLFPYSNNHLSSGLLDNGKGEDRSLFIDSLRYNMMKIFSMAARMGGVRNRRMKVRFSRKGGEVETLVFLEIVEV
jgi:hypothetical protein